jgi:diacylglycerol kinase family enzyme
MASPYPWHRVAAILNDSSRDSQRIGEWLDAAFAHLPEFRIAVTRSSEEATSAARTAAANAQAVIAVGGDGTVADVATGIFGSPAALGIVPAGSTNIVARSLDIPRDPRAAIRLLAVPQATRPLDVGRCGERCFLHMAGAGVDAALFAATDPALKRSLGWLAYLPPAAAALTLPPSLVRVTVDDVSVERTSSFVLVANGGSLVAPALTLDRQIVNDDGWLDVLIFAPIAPLSGADLLRHAGQRRIASSPHITHLRGRTVVLEADPPLPVQLDGDVRGDTPATFTLAHRALNVIVPSADCRRN